MKPGTQVYTAGFPFVNDPNRYLSMVRKVPAKP